MNILWTSDNFRKPAVTLYLGSQPKKKPLGNTSLGLQVCGRMCFRIQEPTPERWVSQRTGDRGNVRQGVHLLSVMRVGFLSNILGESNTETGFFRTHTLASCGICIISHFLYSYKFLHKSRTVVFSVLPRGLKDQLNYINISFLS